MHVVLAGAGAVGSHYGALMHLGGMRVSLLARGSHLQAMQKHGLRHESMGRERIVRAPATGDPACLRDADVVLVTCKMTGLENLLDTAAPFIGSDALLISLQNGVQAPAKLAGRFPDHTIAAGIAFIGARLESPGHVIHSAAGRLAFGHWQHGSEGGRLAAFVEALGGCGIDARLVGDIRPLIWRKMLWNCGFNAITALTCRFAADIAQPGDCRQLAEAAMRETLRVAEAHGVALGERDVAQAMQDTLSCGPVKTSMWQDLERGQQTEIDFLNGHIASESLRLGLEAPVNGMLAALMRARQDQSN